MHLYPYTHVQALLGLARIAQIDGDAAQAEHLLRQTLRLAGRRSLLEEYIAVIEAIVALGVAAAPVPVLVESILDVVRDRTEFRCEHVAFALERWLAM